MIPLPSVRSLVVGLVLLALLAYAAAGIAAWRDRVHRDAGSEARGAAAVVQHEATQAAAQYRVDTVNLGVALARYQAMVDSASRLRARLAADRAATHDTAYLPPDIRDTVIGAQGAALAGADTAVRACRAVQTTCERRVLLADSLSALLRVQLAAAEYRPRLTRDVGAAYDLTARAVQADASVSLRLVGGLSAYGGVRQTFLNGESPRLLLGARVSF